jgi:hypothetical protein
MNVIKVIQNAFQRDRRKYVALLMLRRKMARKKNQSVYF